MPPDVSIRSLAPIFTVNDSVQRSLPVADNMAMMLTSFKELFTPMNL
jgi:hypothetical protein